MIDSHCHIDLPAFNKDREQVIEQAMQQGISRILVPGLTVLQFDALRVLKDQFKCIDICLGLHPYFLPLESAQTQKQTLHQLSALIEKHSDDIIAIGETGLDGTLPIQMMHQEQYLAHQIALAKQYSKPLVLHHRQSHNALIALLKRHRFQNGGVIHAFSGSYQTAQTYIAMGFLLGVGGTITYPRAKKTRDTIKKVDLQHLLLETDSPDMPLNGYQGTRNVPTQVFKVANVLAKLKQCDVSVIDDVTDQNYYRMFGD